MKFEDAVANAPVILTEGAVIERLRRDPAVELDPHIANAGLIYDQAGKQTMTRIYRQYIDIASRYHLPMIVSAPTWRASSERINQSAYSGRETMIIDAAVNPGPLFYQINCVHPAIFRKAIEQSEPGFDRLLGLQANTSEKSPEELDGLGYLDTSEPKEFAESMLALHTQFGLKIIGGCCGTDHRHIEEIAKGVSGMTNSSDVR